MIQLDMESYDRFAFDLDGVLVASEAVVEAALRRWAIEERVCPNYVLRKSRSRRDVDLVADILPGLWPQREAERIAAYEVDAMDRLSLVPGAAEFFHSLPLHNRCIVTSSSRISAMHRLHVAGIIPPDVMITAEDVRLGKPYPEPYLTMLKQCKVDPDRCLVFEDSHTGVASAVAAGCDCIGIGDAVHGHPKIIDWLPDFQNFLEANTMQVRAQEVEQWQQA